MAGLFDIFGAFKAGKIIANPALWKNVGNLTNVISSLLSALIVLYRIFIGPLPITDEDLIKISGSLATLLLMFNNVITTITTKKNVSVIGIPQPEGEANVKL